MLPESKKIHSSYLLFYRILFRHILSICTSSLESFFFFLLIPLRVKISSFPGIPVASSYSLSLPAHKFTTSPATQECGLLFHRKTRAALMYPLLYIRHICPSYCFISCHTTVFFFFFSPLNIYCISLSTVKDFERRQAWITAMQLYLKLY